MAEISLTLACTVSDRSRPILDGRITIPGCRLVTLPGESDDIFRRALRDRAFDITELSMASHIVTTARGDNPYIAIPVFLSRAFRHSAIYIRTDRGVATAADLRGRTIGLREYQQTLALWIRGLLRDGHGIAAREMRWRTGGLERPGGGERIAIDLPADLDLKQVGPGDTINGLFAAGELDAVISGQPPSCFTKKTAPVARLFPDYREAEAAYHKSTGFFPIMHCVAIRKDVAAAHPWVAVELFRAFAKAKAIAMADLQASNILRVSLPWVAAEYESTQNLMGANFWPYGFKANVKELGAMIDYAASDGLIARKLDPAELFEPSTLGEADQA
ncbi:MAG: ABC transporter substrate-binding protein [Pseudomonadota bacterium]|nr:ABC transporter substrate-binding protein [Pseudomonadota bacterium]